MPTERIAVSHSTNGAVPAPKPDLLANFATADDMAAQRREEQGIGPAWTAGDLLRAHFPPAVCVVPDLVPVGLTILAGRPKIGKSWLLLQIAIAVGTGGVVLGREVERRKVLVLALEDSPRRLRDRLQKLNCPDDADITFYNQFPTLQKQGALLLRQEIEQGDYGLTIVDTFSRFAAIRKAEDEQQAGHLMGGLQMYALEQQRALLVSDHHRKAAAGSAQDLIDDVSGNTVKTGVLDAVLGLYRQRGKAAAELKAAGRDVPDVELAVRFDRELTCWQFEGDADSVRADSLRATMLDAMINNFGGECTVSALARFLGKSPSNLYPEMQELVVAGRVFRMPKRGSEVPFRVA